MGLLGFGKKKEEISTCACGGSCKPDNLENARFIVLGACCSKSRETFENAKTAVKELGFSEEVVNVGDNTVIAKYGVMQTPALVIDGKVVSYGKKLQVEDVKSLLVNVEK